jgi:hypothetical protein
VNTGYFVDCKYVHGASRGPATIPFYGFMPKIPALGLAMNSNKILNYF